MSFLHFLDNFPSLNAGKARDECTGRGKAGSSVLKPTFMISAVCEYKDSRQLAQFS